MRILPPPKPFIRKRLDHTPHSIARFGAEYFITICCRQRKLNQLCNETVAKAIFATAARYDQQQRWYLLLLLLMPDHLHALISVGGEPSLAKIIAGFKRATAKYAGVRWQRNFFDHRLHHDESIETKGEYIRQNPVRAGLVSEPDDWEYFLDRTALNDGRSVTGRYR